MGLGAGWWTGGVRVLSAPLSATRGGMGCGRGRAHPERGRVRDSSPSGGAADTRRLGSGGAACRGVSLFGILPQASLAYSLPSSSPPPPHTHTHNAQTGEGGESSRLCLACHKVEITYECMPCQ